MNDWLLIYEVCSCGNILRYDIVLTAPSPEMAAQAAQRIGATWWPDCENEDERDHWRWRRGEVRLQTFWQVDDAQQCPVPVDFRHVDRQVVTGAPDGLLIVDEWDERWETLFRWRW